jgi:flagellar hook-associated protein 3 FlgL
MRVTPITIANDIIDNLENTYQTIQALNRQISSGKRINQPSDDPAGTAYAVDLQASHDWNKQDQSSSQSALNWLQTTTSALQQLSDVATRARTRAVLGANDTNTPADRTDISQEVTQLIQQVVQIGNTTFGNTSIFAGTQVTTTPFNAQGGYAGDTGSINHQLGPGYNMRVNADPTAIFTGTNGIFNVLENLQQHLTSGNAFTPAKNVGSETLGLTGTYSGAAATYTVQVTAVTGGKITGIQYSTTGGAPWTPVAGVGTPPTFALPSGMTASFTNGALTPTVGDQFTISATGPGPASAFTTLATKNIGNEQVTLTSPSTLPGNPTITVRAAQLDVNNNVIGVQVSTDGGVTFGPTITANEAKPTTEQMSFNGMAYTGPTANYLVRVASVSSGSPATVVYSTDGGTTWSAPVAGVGSPPQFTVAPNLILSFGGGTAQVNDQFSFTATAGGAGQNINGITALSYPTTTTFNGGNGLAFSWTQSSYNPNLVVSNSDSFTFTPADTGLSNDIAALDTTIGTLSGQEAQFGAQSNAVQANMNQLQSIDTEVQRALSQDADADIAALTTQAATANTIYQAALAVDARSIEPTLVEFLK